MAQHIFKGTGAPAFTPTRLGQHYIDEVGKKSYVSVGIDSSADWRQGSATRVDTSSNWTALNPTLDAGMFGFESNTGKYKIGDGLTAWNTLLYFSAGLSLDQTAPQTVIDGRPIFLEGIKLGTTPVGEAWGAGNVFYDAVNRCMAVQCGPETTLQVGQEAVVLVQNNTGSTLANGHAVYVTGANGDIPYVAHAQANDIAKTSILGILTQDILDGQTGFATTRGIIHDVNTSGFAAGDILYLDPATPGHFTNVKPEPPNYVVRLGRALVINATTGSIYSQPVEQTLVQDLLDVKIVSPQDGQRLTYDTVLSRWINADPVVGPADKTTYDFSVASGAARESSGLIGTPNSSSLISGVGSTTFSVGACSGYINDHAGSYVKVDYAGATGIAVAGEAYNFIGLDTAGAITVSTTELDPLTHLRLGGGFVIGGVIIDAVNNPDWAGNAMGRIRDMVANGIGAAVEGLRVSEQATPLKLTAATGEIRMELSKWTVSSPITTFTKLYNNGAWVPDGSSVNYVNTTQINNYGVGLQTMTDGFWKKDLVLVSSAGSLYYIYAQAEYPIRDLAMNGSLPAIPEAVARDTAFLAAIVCRKGDTSIASRLIDIRPDHTRVYGYEAVTQTAYDIPSHAGFRTQPLPTNVGDGTMAISGVVADFYDNNKESISPVYITATAGLALTDQVTNYIAADRDTASWVALTDKSLIDYVRYLPYAESFRSGNNTHIQPIAIRGYGEVEANYDRISSVQRYSRESGLDAIAVDSSLNLIINGGYVWAVNTRLAIADVTAATRQFENFKVGASWITRSHTTPEINNQVYNDTAGITLTSGQSLVVGLTYQIVTRSTIDFTTYGAANNTVGTIFLATGAGTLGSGDSVLTGEAVLTAGYYGIVYLYRGVEEADHTYAVYGTAEYATLDLAKASSAIGSIPELVSSHAVLLGRVIFQKGMTTGFTIESAFTTTFAAASPITAHGSLSGLANDDHTQYFNQSRGDARYIQKNASIGAATHTKITYDANGLVTAGADATTADIADSSNKRYVTDAELVVIGNTSGTNSGNETATTIGTLVNGAASKTTPVDADVLAMADSAASFILKHLTWANLKAGIQTLTDTLYVAKNTAIAGATHTKITYDAKGLVTSGADATTADIASSSNNRYVTDADLVVIGNTSGTNSGNETETTIGALVNAATEKITPVDADMVGLMDSAASNLLKKLSWVNIKATMKTYMDTLYVPLSRTVNGKALSSNITVTLASADHANEGTTTTVLHGNAAGNPAWGAVVEADITLADNTTNNFSTTRHGLVPKGTNVGAFLHDDGTWALPIGYTLTAVAASLTTWTDAATYYFGGLNKSPITTAAVSRMYIPKAGTITSASIFWYASGTAGTAESITMNIRLNNTTNTAIASVATTAANKLFSNAALSIPVAVNDYIEIMIVCPTWATNPATVVVGGTVHIE